MASYPATFSDDDGTVRLVGTVDFDGTNPGEAPITQGGPLTANLKLGSPGGVANLPGVLAQADADGTGGGVAALRGGNALDTGDPGGAAVLQGGDSAAANAGASVEAGGGTAAATGKVTINTAGSTGDAGQALVSDGASGLKYGGVQIAAAVPVGAPTGLPLAFDSTPVTGGLYVWNGAAWVKVSTIP